MRVRSILAVAAVAAGLALAAPAAAQTCSSFSLIGSFIVTLGGVNAAGRDVTMLASVTLGAANATGVGSMTGGMFVNERGSALQQVQIASSYQIFTNCVVHLFVPDGGRTAAVTGVAVQNGELILLSSIFDPPVQLTGTARKFP